ncbi:DUF7289 family protein [Halosolutus amylolyticus]
MVAVVSVGIFLVGGEAITSAEQQSEKERVEQGFVELSHQMATTTATNENVSRSMDLDVGDSGAIVMTNTGNIHIRGDDFDENISIGAIEYEAEDGTKIAYQAGGVFRETMDQTQVKSAPPIHYEDQTLSFPVVEVDEEGELGSGDVTLRRTDTERINSPNTIESETVKINVTSQYYIGWKQYFEQAVGDEGDPIREYGKLNETHGYVEVELGRIDVEAVFENAVVSETEPKEPSNKNAGIEGDVVYGEDVSIEPIDEKIEATIDEAAANYDKLPEDESELSAGKYYVDGDLDTDKYDMQTINVSNGNVTIVVNGSIDVTEDVWVNGWEDDGNEVQIYTNGDLDLDSHLYVAESAYKPGVGNEPETDNINSRYLQVYGTSDFKMTLSDNDYYEGIVYAPGGSVESIGGTADIYGSVVVSDVDISGGNSKIWHDDSLDDSFEPRMEDGGHLPPRITYLNVVKYGLEIDN